MGQFKFSDEPQDILTEAARKNFGINYLFPYQRLVISNILEAADADYSDNETFEERPKKQIVILPTGAGKSLCFMLPAKLLNRPTLVVFPLLSLISDQLRRCNEAGIGAGVLVGGQKESARAAVFSGIAEKRINIVLTNPETALSKGVLPRLAECRFGHIVFDEAHTISEWGGSFRPAYLECRRIFVEADIPIVTAFTATASETVLERVKQVLFPEESPHIVSANPDRPNIAYTLLPSICKINSLQFLLAGTAKHKTKPEITPPMGSKSQDRRPTQRPALVFCATRRTAEKTALQLRMRLSEDEIFFYHAGLTKEEKQRIEKWFFSSDNGILCATTAYGMGIDKPNIRTVIHHDLSPSVEAYLQESGRAGRDKLTAEAILLLSPSDITAAAAKGDRYTSLLEFALDNSTCRRSSLMRLLGAEPETCFGCDVCRGDVKTTASYEDEVIKFIKRNRRVFDTAGTVRRLTAIYPELKDSDAAEVLSQLKEAGRIRSIRYGPWKGKII